MVIAGGSGWMERAKERIIYRCGVNDSNIVPGGICSLPTSGPWLVDHMGEKGFGSLPQGTPNR